MKKTFRFIMAQLDFLVGDIEGNTQKIIKSANIAKNELRGNLIAFPELAITGYPPEDLLYRDGLYERIKVAVANIAESAQGIDILVGYPVKQYDNYYNAAGLFRNSKLVATYFKMCLPNYSVFDEIRYFKPGTKPLVVDYDGMPLGITICEDLWHSRPLDKTVTAGARLVVSLNASPFDMHKHEARTKMLHDRAYEKNVPILYVNCIGGQDELVFDGGSLVLNEDSVVFQSGPSYEERLIPVDFSYDTTQQKISLVQYPVLPTMTHEARIYGALVLGVRDYVEKNHFPSAIIGLSGGIDSALTLAIAVDALGADRIQGVLMPSKFTAEISIEDAKAQAKLMNVATLTIPIEKPFSAFKDSLETIMAGLTDLTEQNLQARCRGTLLMALSNNNGGIVLATGNKSEMSVGYCTLYGDMAGGFCVLKDIPKTLVYQLAQYRNSLNHVIPDRVINREPTAELAANQKDQDILPPYPVLDKILELYIEKDRSYKYIIDQGFDPEIVKKIILMVDRSEYKRRQAAPGVRITRRAFGKDRRYPITSGYTKHLRLK